MVKPLRESLKSEIPPINWECVFVCVVGGGGGGRGVVSDLCKHGLEADTEQFYTIS